MAVSEDLLAGRALLYQAVLGVTRLIIGLLVLLVPGAEALSWCAACVSWKNIKLAVGEEYIPV